MSEGRVARGLRIGSVIRDVFELLADGMSVLLFAPGIYGGILRMPEDF